MQTLRKKRMSKVEPMPKEDQQAQERNKAQWKLNKAEKENQRTKE